MRPLLFAALAACLLATAAHATADRPNIVLILIDDMGWKDLGCTGSTVHRTPNLDRLAARGVVFDQAYASAPNCAPTRACLMTGLWTPRHGVFTVEDSMGGRPESRPFIAPPNHTDLDPRFRTIAEMLRDAGYRTSCVGKWNLGQGTNTPHSPTGQGFDEFRHYKRLGFRDGYFDGVRYSTDVLFDEAIDVARAAEADDRPFFIFLAPDAVHTPLAAPDATIAGYPDLDADRAIYAAMVEHVDGGVGRLLDALPPDTVFVFTSDNGGDVSDNTPLRADKGAMYEGGLRVPLIVAGPGIEGDAAEGRRSTTPCQSIDLVPTILDLCGVPVPGDLDGESLADELGGGVAIDRERLFWHFPAYIGRNAPTSAMREGDWKIIESLENGSVELYDLSNDPGESRNLAERDPAKARTMLAALKAWQRETDAPGLVGPNPAFDASATVRNGREGGRSGGQDAGRGGRAARTRTTSPGTEPWLAAHAEELDADADGVLTRAEIATDLGITMQGGDANGDGAIDDGEAESMRGVRSASAGFLRGHFAELDADDDGMVSAEELAAGFGRMFDRMDADGDGRLAPAERNTAQERGRGGRNGDQRDGRRGREVVETAPRPAGSTASAGPEPPQAAAFRAFDDSVDVRWDADWIYVESDGMPEHPMMVGITTWNRQVPIPHAYRGDNAFRLPRRPVVADAPIAVPYDGPVAVAVNGIPIFNPIKQNGRTDTAAAGELDRWGGHAGRGDDYHYHVLPTHLAESLPPGAPIAFALDGHPILGPDDLVGRRPTAPRDLDASHGHAHSHPHPDSGETWLDEPYHYHGSFDEPPYIQATFRGEVDLDARPVARGVRPFTTPLRGATVTGFERLGEAHWTLTYDVAGDRGSIDYQRDDDGTWKFVFRDPAGTTSTETHRERAKGAAARPSTDRPQPNAGRSERPRGALASPRPRPDRPASGAGDDRPRNVLLVVADDLGFADVGFHGGPVDTPHLDRLRAEGVELSRYYTMHTCGPTRAGIITGCTSYRVGVTGNPEMLGPGVPLDFRLISEAFQDAGHRTAMLGKWHAGGAEGYRPTERGFDSFLGCLGGAIDSYTHQGGQPRTLDWWRDTTLSEEPGYTTDLLADEAVRVIESASRDDRPFFIMLSYDAVHGPLRAPDDLVAKYRGRGVDDSRRATMLAMIEAMDTATGRVLDALDRTNTADDTIVVFVSDNGGQEPYGINTPWRGWKGELLEGGVHGIGVVRLPGAIRPGSTSDQPIAMYDLFPTLAGLAGIATGVEDLDGVDLSTALTEGVVVPRPPIAGGGGDVAIIDGDWKLLRPRRGDESLYDLANDPQETTDRLAEEPAIAARLRAVAEALPRNQAFQKSGGGRGRESGNDRRERPERETPGRTDRGDRRGGRGRESD